MLTITLDESDCFAAWVSAKDAGFSSSDGSDPKREISDLITFYTHSEFCRTEANVILQKAHVLTECVPVISPVNLGGLLLQALLEFWPRTRINPIDEEENEGSQGKEAVSGQILRCGRVCVLFLWFQFISCCSFSLSYSRIASV